MTHLDHDHRKRENISFLVVFFHLIHDFWCIPSRGITLVLQADVCDACVTGGVDEDVVLCHRHQKGN